MPPDNRCISEPRWALACPGGLCAITDHHRRTVALEDEESAPCHATSPADTEACERRKSDMECATGHL